MLTEKEDIAALLEDYSYMISALISAYEVTTNRDYLDKAITLTELSIDNLWDENMAVSLTLQNSFCQSDRKIYTILHIHHQIQ